MPCPCTFWRCCEGVALFQAEPLRKSTGAPCVRGPTNGPIVPANRVEIKRDVWKYKESCRNQKRRTVDLNDGIGINPTKNVCNCVKRDVYNSKETCFESV